MFICVACPMIFVLRLAGAIWHGPDAGVRDLLNASSQEVALLQNSHIKIGGRYGGCIY